MAGDLNIDEFLVRGDIALEGIAAAGAPVLHDYGARVKIGLGRPSPRLKTMMAAAAPPAPEAETVSERLGEQAFAYRRSGDFGAAKRQRAHVARSWGARDAGGPQPLVPLVGRAAESGQVGAPPAPARSRSLSDRLAGRIAVGLVLVSGPTPDLTLSEDEQIKIAAEVQNGLTWLAGNSPARDVTWAQHIETLTVDVADTPSAADWEDYEAPWRDAALRQLGMPVGLDGVSTFITHLKAELQAERAFCAFFTKYTLWHFAYAGLGGPRLVMHYGNDGWGPDNIDRVFAHETCHIFGAPDEYASSGCDCGGAYGPDGVPNANCENGAVGGGVPCIMRANTWAMCDYTFRHLGYSS